MIIGKIVKSESHINYVCQIFGPNEAVQRPRPEDYAFGRFVRVAIRSEQPDDMYDSLMHYEHGANQTPNTYAVGVIYDTILMNPAYGVLGPRLSNETQVELFSPDYISEKAILIYVMILGVIEQDAQDEQTASQLSSITQGVPLLSLELDSEVETMTDEEVAAFHFFSDPVNASIQGDGQPYLHMGYLPHVISQRNSLLPMVALRIIDQLERLFPQNIALLSIVKRNFAWRLKVETAG
ncbi:MAG TPA: hypothetical protein DHW02_12560 [Ktedonobacter sp.]|nr:hypothetical protein [Ktedonobacter sp.]